MVTKIVFKLLNDNPRRLFRFLEETFAVNVHNCDLHAQKTTVTFDRKRHEINIVLRENIGIRDVDILLDDDEGAPEDIFFLITFYERNKVVGKFNEILEKGKIGKEYPIIVQCD